MTIKVKTGLGQDSHAFDFSQKKKKITLAGIEIEESAPLKGNSDADVVLHSITNAFSSISGIPVLGKIADELCQNGIKDSKVYLLKSLELLKGWQVDHIAISIECQKPKLLQHFAKMRESLANIMKMSIEDIGITATSGEQLTAFGKGEGIQVFTLVTVSKTM